MSEYHPEAVASLIKDIENCIMVNAQHIARQLDPLVFVTDRYDGFCSALRIDNEWMQRALDNFRELNSMLIDSE